MDFQCEVIAPQKKNVTVIAIAFGVPGKSVAETNATMQREDSARRKSFTSKRDFIEFQLICSACRWGDGTPQKKSVTAKRYFIELTRKKNYTAKREYARGRQCTPEKRYTQIAFH